MHYILIRVKYEELLYHIYDIYLIVRIVFLAGNRLSSVKYTTYRKKSLGNEN